MVTSDFDGIENVAVPAKRAPFVEVGNHTLQIERLERIESRQKRGVRFWLATFRVVASDTAPVGEERVWIMKLEDPAIYLPAIKDFVAAVLADPNAQITGAVVENLLGTGQPATGNVVRCKATARLSKEGKPWTKLEWQPTEVPF
jgi:hypothetical protein